MHYRITNRLRRVIEFAQCYVDDTQLLYPIHIFIAMFEERTGVLGELFLKCKINMDDLCKIANRLITIESKSQHTHFLFYRKISRELLEVLEKAEYIKNKYNQLHMNEGHVMDCLINLENEVSEYLDNTEKELILKITTTARDLAVNLKNYKYQYDNSNGIVIRRSLKSDSDLINDFLINNFNKRWADNVLKAYTHDERLPLFIAYKDNQIIGFATYDVVRDKKGIFGPMGVKKDCRARNIGFNLLHKCLADMKEVGYEYAIINEAGPIEFYEKSCNAVLIPYHYG